MLKIRVVKVISITFKLTLDCFMISINHINSCTIGGDLKMPDTSLQ